jgi:cell pole-organizing protein PopZ
MMSQANANQQTEPTMEEILASIRKIISEDQPADGPKAAAKPAPVKAAVAVEPAPARAAAPAPAAAVDLDVLELTDEIPDEEPPVRAAPRMAPPSPTPAPAIENDVIFQNIEPVAPRTRERTMDDDFISDTTRSAMGRAFHTMNGSQPPQVSLKGGSIEAIFADAVQQAFRPALKEWVDDHSSDIMDQLRPLIRSWMDEHLPPLIEAAVIKEISRAAMRKP